MSFTVEVSSVNKRSLEVRFSIPKGLQDLEQELEQCVRSRVQRGAVLVSVQNEQAAVQAGLEWDAEAVRSTLARLRGLAEQCGLPFNPSGELLLQIAKEHRLESTVLDARKVMPLVLSAAGDALDELGRMRDKEGAVLAASLAGQLERLRIALGEMRVGLSGVVEKHRDQLLRRLRESGLELDVADERVLKELALFADRVDVSEEITRLGSHFEQMEEFLTAREPVGRKIEFLLQEIHRELNTLGSKSPSVAVTRLVMDCKNDLERMREQAANIE